MVTFSTDLLSGGSGFSCSLFGVVAARFRYFIFMFCCVCCIRVVFLDPVWLCDNLVVKEGAECYVVSLVCVLCTICPGLFALFLDDIGRLFFDCDSSWTICCSIFANSRLLSCTSNLS